MPTHTELRKVMEDTLTLMRADLCKDAPQAADKKLASIIESFICKNIEEKFVTQQLDVGTTVKKCIEEKIEAGEFKATFVAALAQEAPKIVMKSSEAALVKMPMFKVTGDSFFGEGYGDKTAVELLKICLEQNRVLLDQVHHLYTVHTGLSNEVMQYMTHHNNLVHAVNNMAGMLKPFQEMTADMDPDATYIVTPEGELFKKDEPVADEAELVPDTSRPTSPACVRAD
jgi:hypothetical protein